MRKYKKAILITCIILIILNFLSLLLLLFTKQNKYIIISSIFGFLVSLFLLINISKKMIGSKERETKLMEIIKDKDLMFSIISHDLKVPANNLRALTNLLLSDDRLSKEEHTKIMRMLYSSAQNHSQLVNNLLDWSKIQMKIQDVRKSKTDVFQIVNNNIRIYKEKCLEKNINLISYVKEKTVIETDSEILDTILRNLIGNAIKFSKEGGCIIINYKLKNRQIMISVEDNGIGMDKRIQEQLFKPSGNTSRYGTFKEKGSGIGLILCFELLKKLKGNIYVKSEPGKGSAFTFTIPLEIDPPKSKKEQKKRLITNLFN